MARKARITRSISTTKATVMVVNVETADVHNDTVTIAGVADEKAALKHAKSVLENEQNKVVSVVSLSTDSKLYAMDEEIFIQYAEVIGEGRTNKNAI